MFWFFFLQLIKKLKVDSEVYVFQSPDFFKDVSFHVSFHVKFGNLRCCDFSINNPQNSCLVMWLLTWNIIFWVKYSIKNGWIYRKGMSFVKTLHTMFSLVTLWQGLTKNILLHTFISLGPRVNSSRSV